MALAFCATVPLAYLVTGAARERRALNPVTRGLLTILRGVPELVWALVFVRVFGLGPAAGVLALGLTYGGMLAKVYAEILESADPAPARALAQAGARRPLAMLYGLLPQAARELTSYTVYRWECAIRASVVMGFVGAGGLGQLMDQAMKMLNGGEASTILLTFMLLVWGADLLSRGLRRALDTPPAARASAWGWRSALTCAALALGVAASFAMLEMDLPSLFTGAAGRSMLEFVISFFPPDTSAEWLRKVAVGVWRRWPSPWSAPCWRPCWACCWRCRAGALPGAWCSTCCAPCPSWSGPPSPPWPWAWARSQARWRWRCTRPACWGACMPRPCRTSPPPPPKRCACPAAAAPWHSSTRRCPAPRRSCWPTRCTAGR